MSDVLTLMLALFDNGSDLVFMSVLNSSSDSFIVNCFYANLTIILVSYLANVAVVVWTIRHEIHERQFFKWLRSHVTATAFVSVAGAR